MIEPPFHGLPDISLNHDSALARVFTEHGCKTFHQACERVWKIPYGRNSNSHNLTLVLSENMGTCSTKHALLKALADEVGINIQLIVGIYPMNEQNTPGVSEVLGRSNMAFMPEAHCYLCYKGDRIDLTKHSASPSQQISAFFLERQIQPSEIGETKQSIHKQFLIAQFGENNLDRLWHIREECINALCST